jgi:hypothetical protein
MRLIMTRVTSFDPRSPSIARVYDYLLGGKDNFAADRAVAEKLLAVYPPIIETVPESRRFVERAVVDKDVAARVHEMPDAMPGGPWPGAPAMEKGRGTGLWPGSEHSGAGAEVYSDHVRWRSGGMRCSRLSRRTCPKNRTA